MGVLFLACIVELWSWNFWFLECIWLGLLAHLVASLLAAFAAPAAWRTHAAVTSFFIPGVGWAAGLVHFGLRSQPGTAVEEFREHTRPAPVPPAEEPLTVEEQLKRALTHSQTLAAGSGGGARGARTLAESVSVSGGRAKILQLLALLKNPQEDAYHIAAAKIARLQEYFAVRIYEAKQNAAEHPAALGEVYVEYLKSGLLDGPLANFYYRLAVQRFEQQGAFEPDNPAWPLRVAELHRRNGRYRLALETCEDVLRRWPDNADTRMRILEIYYYGARLGVEEATRQFYDMFERLRASIDPDKIEDAWLRRAASWWFPRA